MVDAIERQRHWNPAVRTLQSYAPPIRASSSSFANRSLDWGDESKTIVEGVLKVVDEINRNGMPFDYLTGNAGLSDSTFRAHSSKAKDCRSTR